MASGEGMQRLQHPDGERRGTPQPAAPRRDVRDGRDLHAAVDAKHLHPLAHERMLDALHRLCLLRLRVRDADLLVELPVDRDVNELVDRRRDDRAAELPVEHRQVRAAADEAHAKRSAGDDHAITRNNVCDYFRMTGHAPRTVPKWRLSVGNPGDAGSGVTGLSCALR